MAKSTPHTCYNFQADWPFLLQIYGQQNLSISLIIFSVFAGVNMMELILFAVIFSQLAPLYDKKKYGRV